MHEWWDNIDVHRITAFKREVLGSHRFNAKSGRIFGSAIFLSHIVTMNRWKLCRSWYLLSQQYYCTLNSVQWWLWRSGRSWPHSQTNSGPGHTQITISTTRSYWKTKIRIFQTQLPSKYNKSQYAYWFNNKKSQNKKHSNNSNIIGSSTEKANRNRRYGSRLKSGNFSCIH